MKRFKGVYTALITPFTDEDELDENGLRQLLQRQIQGRIDGIVVLGTTGEAPTLSAHEKIRVIDIAKQECAQQSTLVAGTGSYSTTQTIENTKAAEKAGVDAALIVTPYYNKPSQEGLYQHFKSVAENSDLPIILYNIPGRAGQNLHIDTLKRLLDIPSIVGIKEASGSITQINDTIEVIRKLRPEFTIFSGDDALTFPVMALGGDGVISVISNILPREVKKLTEDLAAGNFNAARDMHFQLMPMVRMAFLETNPIPLKTMHQMCDLPGGRCRLPLCNLSNENTNRIKTQLALLNHA